MMRQQTQQQWFTPQEAAEYLRLSRSTIYRLTKSGALRVHKVGDARRYKREELDAVAVEE